jgi:hypothetical protein
MSEEILLNDGWKEILGDWKQQNKNIILHEGKRDGGIMDRLYINNVKTSDGSLKAKIKIISDPGGDKNGQLVFRYIDLQRYYFAGIGSFHKKFCIGKRTSNYWLPLVLLGEEKEIDFNTEFDIKVAFLGTKIELYFGEVKIAEYNDNINPYLSGNVGLRTWNQNKVLFEQIVLQKEESRAFVIMPFKQEYRELYDNFISKLLIDKGLKTKRADEIFGNRPIIADIIENIQKSRLIVAFVTEINPNVLYEIGVAHAINKDVIILTPNVEKLPFDIRHLRCIQYYDTIGGSEKLRNDLGATIDQILSNES